MPEGPEIRRARDSLSETLSGKTVEEVSFAFGRLKPFESLLVGQRVVSVNSRGKAMLIRFANDYTLYSHNQLYGRWMIVPRKQYPETGRQLRIELHTDRQSALLYSASDIDVLKDWQLNSHPYLSKLGPELLEPATNLEKVYQRLSGKAYSRRNLMGLLQDQSVLSGMGYICPACQQRP